MKVVLAGIIARYPFGGVTWCSLMYLLGLKELGHEVLYLEDTGECVYDPVKNERSLDPGYGTSLIARTLEPYGLGGRWAFVNYDGVHHGLSVEEVSRWCADADLFLNLSGGSWFWRDEYRRIPHKAFIDSDPAFTQLAIAKGVPWYVEFFEAFDHLFTFGANVGTPASSVPTGSFSWRPTWQPVMLDDWRTSSPPGDRFTSVMSWQIESFTDQGGDKDVEFMGVLDLPARNDAAFPARRERSADAPRRARLVHRGCDESVQDAFGVPGLHPAIEGGIRCGQARLRGDSVGLVQRPHRVLSGLRSSGPRPGHRVDRASSSR